jgi:hypothetical protein
MSDARVELFWSKKWVEALVMLPFFLLVAVFSSQFIDGRWLVSVLLGIFIGGQIYRHIMFKEAGKLSSIPKAKLAAWLFGIQLILIAFLGLLIAFLP